MKRKILIFALCVSLLLGVFSISAFAEDEVITDLTGMTFSFQKPTISFGYGKFNVNGVIDCTTMSFGKKNEEFIGLHIGYDSYGSSSSQISYKVLSSNNTINIFDTQVFTITFTGGDDVTNSSLISWVLENKLAHVHSYSSSTISPTHTDKGYTLYTCECGYTYNDNYVEALGHNYTSTTVEGTCSTKGYTTYTCSCGHSYNEESEALGHKYTSITVDSTCNKKGYTTYTCSLCNYSYTEYLPTTQHNFTEKNCSVCGALNPDFQVKSKDFSTVVTSIGKQISVKTVVGVLGVIALAVVGLVFMWFAIRKVISIFMKAFRKGKISI